jgi:acyl-ACP--UDP-N-acetylglucosamine O-acyltransferase
MSSSVGDPKTRSIAANLPAWKLATRNIIRENVTIHRGTAQARLTRIGHRNFLMVGCHVAHDCQVGNDCVLANNALLAGHCVVEDFAYISGNSAVHQHCRLGRLSLISGCSAVSKDVPPFIIQQGHNQVRGINVVGMRRAGFRSEQIDAIRRLYHIVYLQNLSVPTALARVETELGTYRCCPGIHPLCSRFTAWHLRDTRRFGRRRLRFPLLAEHLRTTWPLNSPLSSPPGMKRAISRGPLRLLDVTELVKSWWLTAAVPMLPWKLPGSWPIASL